MYFNFFKCIYKYIKMKLNTYSHVISNINKFINLRIWEPQQNHGVAVYKWLGDTLTPDRLWFDFWQRQETYHFSQVSRLALQPMQPPLQRKLGAISLEAKQLGCKGGHSPYLIARLRNGNTPMLHHVFTAWTWQTLHFTFNLLTDHFQNWYHPFTFL